MQRAVIGTAALSGLSYIGLLSASRSNGRLLRDIELLRNDRKTCPALPGLHDFKGVIHVHSNLSRDSEGTPEEIIRAAEETGQRFILLTDHNNRKIFAQGMQGRYGDVLVIRGAELIKGGQALLAVGIKEYVDGHSMTIQQAVTAIKAQGGLAFVAHPWLFKEWEVEGIDGMEIYDIADSTVAQIWKAPVMFADILTPGAEHPESVFLRGPLTRPDSYLSKWDGLTQKRKLVGIAGNDAHQNVELFGRLIDPYPLSFKFVQSHILAPALNEPALMRALQAGHVYSSFGLLADASGFQFSARNEGLLGIMGDEVPVTARPVLTAQAPHVGLMRLYRNGQAIHVVTSDKLEYPVREKGVYRIEVALQIGGQQYPWIFSNPIYVESPTAMI